MVKKKLLKLIHTYPNLIHACCFNNKFLMYLGMNSYFLDDDNSYKGSVSDILVVVIEPKSKYKFINIQGSSRLTSCFSDFLKAYNYMPNHR